MCAYYALCTELPARTARYKRFMELLDDRFFDGQLVYRVMPGFVAQFGIAADPAKQNKWNDALIPDDVATEDNAHFSRGSVSFGARGPNTRAYALSRSAGAWSSVPFVRSCRSAVGRLNTHVHRRRA